MKKKFVTNQNYIHIFNFMPITDTLDPGKECELYHLQDFCAMLWHNECAYINYTS